MSAFGISDHWASASRKYGSARSAPPNRSAKSGSDAISQVSVAPGAQLSDDQRTASAAPRRLPLRKGWTRSVPAKNR